MYFNSLADFFAMGGYAVYVWSAFGITFGSMLWLYWHSVAQGKALLKEINQKNQRDARMRAAKEMENTL